MWILLVAQKKNMSCAILFLHSVTTCCLRSGRSSISMCLGETDFVLWLKGCSRWIQISGHLRWIYGKSCVDRSWGTVICWDWSWSYSEFIGVRVFQDKYCQFPLELLKFCWKKSIVCIPTSVWTISTKTKDTATSHVSPKGWTSNLDTFSGISCSATRKIRLHVSLKDLWPILKRHTKKCFFSTTESLDVFQCMHHMKHFLVASISLCPIHVSCHGGADFSTQDPPYSVHSCDGKDPPFVYLASRGNPAAFSRTLMSYLP